MSKQINDIDKQIEEEYKLHSKIIKFHNKIDRNKKDINLVKSTLKNIYELKYVSKKNAIDTICKTIDRTKPIYLNKDDKKLITIINDMNYQHDIKLNEILNLYEKEELKKIQNKSKKLIKNINKNFNDYYEVWCKMIELEKAYKDGYNKYQSNKEKYKNGKIDIPKNICKQLTILYNHLILDIIPEFKKLNIILENIEKERKDLVDKFNELYLSVDDEQFKYITLPITVLDIHKKCYDVIKYKKPIAKITTCIERSWDDAIEDGFNITLFSPCNIIKQTDVLDCDKNYDWPYIEYEPNLFIPWDLGHNQLQWIGRCFSIKNNKPFIGI